MAKELKGKVDIREVNANEKSDEAQKEEIYAVPTLIFYDSSGKEAFRNVGVMRKETVLSKIKELALIKRT